MNHSILKICIFSICASLSGCALITSGTNKNNSALAINSYVSGLKKDKDGIIHIAIVEKGYPRQDLQTPYIIDSPRLEQMPSDVFLKGSILALKNHSIILNKSTLIVKEIMILHGENGLNIETYGSGSKVAIHAMQSINACPSKNGPLRRTTLSFYETKDSLEKTDQLLRKLQDRDAINDMEKQKKLELKVYMYHKY